MASRVFRFVNLKGVKRTINLDDFKPTKLDTGSWVRPALSRLQLARIRNEAYESHAKRIPAEIKKKVRTFKPVIFKGQKHFLLTQKKQDNIAQKLRDMPAKLDDYYTALRSRRQRSYDPLYLVRHGLGRMK